MNQILSIIWLVFLILSQRCAVSSFISFLSLIDNCLISGIQVSLRCLFILGIEFIR